MQRKLSKEYSYAETSAVSELIYLSLIDRLMKKESYFKFSVYEYRHLIEALETGYQILKVEKTNGFILKVIDSIKKKIKVYDSCNKSISRFFQEYTEERQVSLIKRVYSTF